MLFNLEKAASRYAFILPVMCLFSPLFCCSPQHNLPKTDTLTIGVESKPTGIDPRYATDALSSRIGSLVYNGLLKFNEQYNLEPDLADNWDIMSDTHVVFHLRPNVIFHNGAPLTLEDVKYTYDTILAEKSTSPKKGSYQFLKEIRVTADDRIEFILERPFAPLLENLTLGIIPAEWDKPNENKENEPPPGTGPYRIMGSPTGNKIVLEKFPNSFSGPPKLPRIEFRVIKDDSVRMLELMRGSIDLVQNAVNPDLIPQLKASPDIRVETNPGTTYKYIGFNITDPILGDKRVRQAIAYGINRDAIIEGVLQGMAVKASGLLTPDNWAYEPEVMEYEFDPQKAMQLLDAAGHRDPDGQGPEPRFHLVYKTSQNKRANRVAEVIRGDLYRIGIDVKILRYEWPTFYSDIKKGNFQMFSLSWVGVQDPDIYYYIFHSSSFPNGGNRGRDKNKEVDELLEKGRFELDREKRKKTYGRVQKIIAEECPYVSMWHETNIVAMRNRVRGYRLYPRGNFWSLPDVSIDAGITTK